MKQRDSAGATGAEFSDQVYFERMTGQGYLAGPEYLAVRNVGDGGGENGGVSSRGTGADSGFLSAAERMLAFDPAARVAFLSTAPCTMAVAKSGARLPVLLDDLAQLTGPRVPRAGGFGAVRGRLLRPSAVFVRGVGCLCRANDAYEAHALAMVIEKACMAFVGSSFLGGGKPIPFHEAALMRVIYKFKYGRKRK